MTLHCILAMIVLFTGFSAICFADDAEQSPWDIPSLSKAPKTFDDPARDKPGIKAIFYESVPWKGNPTRVFAYVGLPKIEPGKKVPAMVLVHGGGGTALVPWVQLWVSRGYAAIAMDTCGCTPGEGSKHPRHDHGGPAGWGGFGQLDQPIQDQWTYHAVASVILANSLIRSFPEVDPDKVGLTGISWGGYLTCITAGVDQRFKFAAPVYGCGFLGDNSTWLGEFKKMGSENEKKWLKQWDPSSCLPRATMPMLWVTGTTDFAYPMDSLQKSYRLPKSPRTLCVRVDMPHGHGGPGENPEEIHAFANALLKDGVELAKITKAGREEKQFWVTYESKSPIVKAELNYTTDTGNWTNRKWKTVPANLDAKSQKASAEVPADATVYYINVFDKRNLAVSSEHVEAPPVK